MASPAELRCCTSYTLALDNTAMHTPCNRWSLRGGASETGWSKQQAPGCWAHSITRPYKYNYMHMTTGGRGGNDGRTQLPARSAMANAAPPPQ